MRPSFNGLWRHPDFVRLWAGETLFVAVGLTFLGGVWLALSPVARLKAMPAVEGAAG